MITRRGFFRWLGNLSLAGMATATYAFAIEPGFRLRAVTYGFTPARWTPGLKLKVVVLADPHVCEPYMRVTRWERIIEAANALNPDLILLLGDYVTSHRFVLKTVPMADAIAPTRQLRARLGVYAIVGNHDWWEDAQAQSTGQGPTEAQVLLEAAGIPVLENRALRLVQNGQPFWLSGTASSVAVVRGRGVYESRADIDAALAYVTDDAPIIHMAHEPDLFVDIPDRVSLTLSGHTHGGQVRLLGWSPIVPSMYANRFAYGHIQEGNRHLVVSGGLGCSILPVRFGSPPEITVLELGSS